MTPNQARGERGKAPRLTAGYGDETWRLALSADTRALRAASALLDGYDASRATAFAEAVEGRVDAALAVLRAGTDADWPFPAAAALDAARARYLAGDDGGALTELAGAARHGEQVDPGVADVAAIAVARSPGLRLRALRLVLGHGTLRDRLRNGLRVARGS